MPDLLIPPLCWIVQTSAYLAELKRNPADDGTFNVGEIVTPLPLCLYFKAGWICPGFMTGFFLGKSKVNLWSCTMSVSPLRISFWVDIPTWALQVQSSSSQGHWVVSLKGAVAMSTKLWRSSSSSSFVSGNATGKICSLSVLGWVTASWLQTVHLS